jgi:hypothetical protein
MKRILTTFLFVALASQAIADSMWNTFKDSGSRISVYSYSQNSDLAASVYMLNQATFGEFAYEIAYGVSPGQNKNSPHRASCEKWRYVGSEKDSIIFQVSQFYVSVPVTAPWYQQMNLNLSKPKDSKDWAFESNRLCEIGEKLNVDEFMVRIPNSEKAEFTPLGLWKIGKIRLSVEKSTNLLVSSLLGL